MKALTLTQPWASLVASGAKRVETRSWSTRYRGPLAIHAARAFPPPARAACLRGPVAAALAAAGLRGADDLPLGVVLAVCRLTGCRLIAGSAGPPPPPEADFGDHSPGRFAWQLDAVRPLPRPVAARGRLGLWEWSDAMEVGRLQEAGGPGGIRRAPPHCSSPRVAAPDAHRGADAPKTEALHFPAADAGSETFQMRTKAEPSGASTVRYP